jgi:hypothetical protein
VFAVLAGLVHNRQRAQGYEHNCDEDNGLKGFSWGDLATRTNRPNFVIQNEPCSLISIKLRPRRSRLKVGCRGLSDSAPMLAPLFGYFFSMITVLAAAVVLLTGISNISSIGNGRQHLRPPVIGRTVTVEVQRRLPVVKEEAPAKDVSPVVATAKADTKKIKHYKPKAATRHEGLRATSPSCPTFCERLEARTVI